MASHVMITGGDQAAFKDFLESVATHVTLDLEDTVPDARKADVRAAIDPFLQMGHAIDPRKMLGIRISPLSTLDGLRDILALHACKKIPSAITLTKVEGADELRLIDGLLGGRLAQVPFRVIIETPRAVANVEEIAGASRRVVDLSVGGKDLSKSMQMERAWEPLFYARSRIVMAARQFGLGAVDEPYHPHDDLDGLRQQLLRLKAMGFTGKSATTFRQAPVINDVFGIKS